MDIENITQGLFDKIVPTKRQVTKKDTKDTATTQSPTLKVSKEAQTIEYQLNKHLQGKKKTDTYTRVSFIHSSTSDMTDINKFLDEDISVHRKKKKSWSSLPTCDKWNLIKAYHLNNNEPFNEKTMKAMLLKNKLDVNYDILSNNVLKLSIKP